MSESIRSFWERNLNNSLSSYKLNYDYVNHNNFVYDNSSIGNGNGILKSSSSSSSWSPLFNNNNDDNDIHMRRNLIKTKIPATDIESKSMTISESEITSSTTSTSVPIKNVAMKTTPTTFDTSAVLTDIGICVRMQNVNLLPNIALNAINLIDYNNHYKNNSNNNTNLFVPSCCSFDDFKNIIKNSNTEQNINNDDDDMDNNDIDNNDNENSIIKNYNGVLNKSKRDYYNGKCLNRYKHNNSIIIKNYQKSKTIESSSLHHSKKDKIKNFEFNKICKLQQEGKQQNNKNCIKNNHHHYNRKHKKHQVEQKQCQNFHIQKKDNDNDMIINNSSSSSSSSSSTNNSSNCLITPPPKKKWIRHYMMEEPYINGQSLPSSSIYVISTSKSSSPLLSSSLSKQQQKQQQREHLPKLKLQQKQKQQKHNNKNNNNNDNKNNSNNNRSNNILDDDKDQIMMIVDDVDNNEKSSIQSKYRLPPTTINSNKNYSTSPSLLSNYKFYSSSSPTTKIISSKNNNNKKFIPLTPPPISNNNNNNKIEISRTRSLSFSSNKFTANNGGIINNNTSNSSNSSNNNTTSPSSISSLSSSSIISSGNVNNSNNININNNNNNNNNNGGNNNNTIMMMTSSVTEDSSQSSLNLSSSGYLSGSSVNSNSGNCTPSININLLNNSINVNNTNNNNSIINSDNPQQNVLTSTQQNQQSTSGMTISSTTTTSGRRRTTSTNSNGGTQRSPCILRAGTREVHNKLEKHRRAHLKECFEQLKVQLQLKEEDRKKPSNLAILGAAYKHVMSLRRRERELEQQVEQLAKEKINAQKKIFNLKRELSVKYDNIDFSNIISDGDVGNIPNDRESLSDTASLSSGRGSIRYSSSSSLSSVNTISSPVGSNIQSSVPATLSPVISSSLSSSSIPPATTSPSSPSLKSSSSPILTNNVIPLSLTTKNHHNTSPTASSSSIQMESPIPSTPSPSPSSSSGISCSPITSSSSPPMITNNLSSSLSDNFKLSTTNVPNGIKLSHYPITSQQSNVTIVATTSATNLLSSNDNGCLNSSSLLNTSNNGGIHHQSSYGFTSQNVQISASTPKDLNGKNGICNRKNPFLDSTKGEIITSSCGSMVPTTNLVSVGGVGGISTNVNCTKEIKVEKINFDDSEQPTKVIKLFNGIALAPVDKDNKLLSSAPLALSQVVGGGGLVVSPFPVLTTPSHQGLRVIGTANGLATIELSSAAAGVQSHNRNQQQQPQSVVTPPSVSTVTSTSAGAQLHKLLVSAGSQSQINHHPTVVNSHLTHATTNIAPELARLPGGAELNILPAGVNGSTTLYRGNGKLAIVNNGISLKGTETNGTAGRAVHVVTPLQSAGGGSISGLAPIVVSQGGQQGNNLAQLIASTSQLTGKVNLSVGGQTLPLISTQYLGSMKPMVVAVANNQTTATVAGTTLTENCSS